MKKGILFLLLLATIAVTSRYFYPEKSAHMPVTTHPVIPSGSVIIEDIPSDRQEPTAYVPAQPVAEVEDAIYEDFSEVVDADIYELIPGSFLGRVRTDGDVSYPGKVMLDHGKVAVKNEAVVAGAFLLDMQSLMLDVPNDELLAEVKGAGYLDVETYPQASFVLQEVFTDKISGILTLKGVSKKVTFPALVIITDTKLRMFSDFSIDRTEWGIMPDSSTLSVYLDLHVEWILTQT